MNANDTNDVLRANRRAVRERADERARVLAVMQAWENGDVDAFDAPAPSSVRVTFEEEP